MVEEGTFVIVFIIIIFITQSIIFNMYHRCLTHQIQLEEVILLRGEKKMIFNLGAIDGGDEGGKHVDETTGRQTCS